ncbi:hypothetical protein [Oceanidesulfovibrio marinus]|uniref:hypothetical protein n=1 Tax=Oceanidesulfovibrio marinus TaxID=370038 RepID=UPI00118583B5|nr:hypothetical protein [Oceanidesulfovibrio marinus]
MPADNKTLDKSIKVIEQSLPEILKRSPSPDLISFEQLGLKDAPPSVPYILELTGAIRKTQGTSNVYVLETTRDKQERYLSDLRECINTIVVKLKENPFNRLSKNEITPILQEYNLDPYYYSILQILSLEHLAVSVGAGRTGGFELYTTKTQDKTIDDTAKDLSKFKDGEKKAQEKKHESKLYPYAHEILSQEGYQAVTLGVKRRLPGRWNTPDVIGYRLNRFSVLCGAEMEVVTVEVKWQVDKEAIAEAHSHQRRAHKSYLMAHQELMDIDGPSICDLGEKGIGLICLINNQFFIHSHPRANSISLKDIDDFLNDALETEDRKSLQEEIAQAFCSGALSPLLPSS